MKLKRWDEIIKRVKMLPMIKMAEVGVWRGENAIHLLTALPQLNWHGIDTWVPPAPDSSYAKSGAEIAHKPYADYKAAREAVVKAIMPFNFKAQMIVDDSIKASSYFAEETFDIVFIDADHSYEGCINDIAAWLPKVKVGGWIGGHDYADVKGNVKEAVDKAFGADIERGEDWTWFHRVKGDEYAR